MRVGLRTPVEYVYVSHNEWEKLRRVKAEGKKIHQLEALRIL